MVKIMAPGKVYEFQDIDKSTIKVGSEVQVSLWGTHKETGERVLTEPVIGTIDWIEKDRIALTVEAHQFGIDEIWFPMADRMINGIWIAIDR